MVISLNVLNRLNCSSLKPIPLSLIDKLEKLGVKVPTPVQNVLEVLDLNGVTESVKTAQNVIKNLGLDKNDESTNINK